MKLRLRPCAAFILAIGAPGSWRAAPPPAAGLEPALPAGSASAPVTATTAPPAGGDATAEPSTATSPSRSLSPREQLDAERESRTRYALGEAAFKAGRYLQAVVEFEAGFEAVPKPGFLLDIGHAYRRLGAFHKARAAYKKFLLVDPTSALHDDVLSLIGQLDSALADDDRADRLAARALTAALVPPPMESHAVGSGIDLGARTPALTPGSGSTARPFYRRPWFWMAVGAVAIGTGVGIYAVRGRTDEGAHSTGSLGVLRP